MWTIIAIIVVIAIIWWLLPILAIVVPIVLAAVFVVKSIQYTNVIKKLNVLLSKDFDEGIFNGTTSTSNLQEVFSPFINKLSTKFFDFVSSFFNNRADIVKKLK